MIKEHYISSYYSDKDLKKFNAIYDNLEQIKKIVPELSNIDKKGQLQRILCIMMVERILERLQK